MNESPSSGPAASGTPPAASSLGRSGLHALAASLLSVVLGVALNILIARAVGPAGKGSYDLALATAALLGMVLGFSLPSGVTYVVARGRANLRVLARPLAALALGQAVLAAGILYALRFTSYSAFLLPSAWGAWVIAAVALYVFFAGLTSYWRAMLIGRQEIIRTNQRELISRAAHVLGLLAVIGVFAQQQRRLSSEMLIVLSVAVALLASLILFHALRLSSSASPGQSGLKEITAYALPCYIGNLAQFLNYRLDVFFVSYFAGVAAVGLYTLAVTLCQQIWLISTAAATVLLPRVAASHRGGAENAAKIAQATRLALWCSAFSAVLLAVLARPLLYWVFGEAFLPSLPALLWLLPGIVAFSIAAVVAAYFAGVGKPRLNLLVALAGLFITIVLDVVLIPRYQITGAAIASTASYGWSAVLSLWFFKRETGMPLVSLLLPNRADLATLQALIHDTRSGGIFK